MAEERLQKSKFCIIPGKSSGSSIQYDENSKIVFSFNPSDYSITDANNYQQSKNPGTTSPLIKFSQGQARTLSVDLMLDTMMSEKGENEKEDVRDVYIARLQKLMEINGEIHKPSPCRVLWGSLKFDGVLERMDNLKYTLFNSQGIPVRATVKLTFIEYISLDQQAKDPPRNSPDRRKVFKMTQDETIWHMAYTAYGDAALWRVIAEANNIDDPFYVEAGKDLIIPVLEPAHA